MSSRVDLVVSTSTPLMLSTSPRPYTSTTGLQPVEQVRAERWDDRLRNRGRCPVRVSNVTCACKGETGGQGRSAMVGMGGLGLPRTATSASALQNASAALPSVPLTRDTDTVPTPCID